jgi:hypothetical protein
MSKRNDQPKRLWASLGFIAGVAACGGADDGAAIVAV